MMNAAVIGAGNMATHRTEALLSTNGVNLCAVASRHLESAERFAQQYDVPYATYDYRCLSELKLDIVMIEVPHNTQDEIVLWALKHNIHVLIGSCLATTVNTGEIIAALAASSKLIVESGFEARYKECWIHAKQLIEQGQIGNPSFVNAMALWEPPQSSWYLHQEMSCGMPLTHMSYAFINPLRWLFGEPTHIYATANKKKHTGTEVVSEETCLASLRFDSDVLVSLTCSYLSIREAKRWYLEIYGTEGMLLIHPGEFDSGKVYLHRNQQEVIEYAYQHATDAFERQIRFFLDAVHTASPDICLNRPEDSINDVKITSAIVQSAFTSKALTLSESNKKTIFYERQDLSADQTAD